MEEATAVAVPKKRAAWLDTSRCLAMYFILWLHAGAPTEWVSHIISGTLFLFFFWAGYFMPQEPGKCALRGLKLGMVWCIWSLLAWVYYLIYYPEEAFQWERMVGWGASSYDPPLWFLRVLTLSQLLIAGMLALRILPRYKWFVLVLLAGFCYAAGLPQHEYLRFNWMMVIMLGFCVRGVSVDSLRAWFVRHAWPILILGGLWYAQWTYYPELLGLFDLKSYKCGLQLPGLWWAAVLTLAAIGIENYLPKLARPMAAVGSCMIFCYVSHHILYSRTVYCYCIKWATNFWVPFLALPLLTGLYLLLARYLPRFTRILCGK